MFSANRKKIEEEAQKDIEMITAEQPSGERTFCIKACYGIRRVSDVSARDAHWWLVVGKGRGYSHSQS